MEARMKSSGHAVHNASSHAVAISRLAVCKASTRDGEAHSSKQELLGENQVHKLMNELTALVLNTEWRSVQKTGCV
jgi:hypothetical protein